MSIKTYSAPQGDFYGELQEDGPWARLLTIRDEEGCRVLTVSIGALPEEFIHFLVSTIEGAYREGRSQGRVLGIEQAHHQIRTTFGAIGIGQYDQLASSVEELSRRLDRVEKS